MADLTELQEAILHTKREHPTWSVADIANEVGCSESYARQVLKNHDTSKLEMLDHEPATAEDVDPVGTSSDTSSSTESKPERPTTDLRGYLPHVAVMTVAVVGGLTMVITDSYANVGAVVYSVGLFGAPVAVGVDTYHLRSHQGNYKPSLLWIVGVFFTLGLLSLWYLGRRIARTNLSAALD